MSEHNDLRDADEEDARQQLASSIAPEELQALLTASTGLLEDELKLSDGHV